MKTKDKTVTDVAEDLRNEYQTGKLVPYQSVICEGKIVGNDKIKLSEMPNKKSPKPKRYTPTPDQMKTLMNAVLTHVEEMMTILDQEFGDSILESKELESLCFDEVVSLIEDINEDDIDNAARDSVATDAQEKRIIDEDDIEED